MAAAPIVQFLLNTAPKVAPHIGKAKKGLSLLAKAQRLLMKGKGVAGKSGELLKLSRAKPFPDKLISATQRNQLLNTQRTNLMLRGGEQVSKLPWYHPKKLLWESALLGEDPLTRQLKKHEEKLKLNIEKQKALRQEENEIAAAQIQMDGDNQLAMQEAEGARLAKELQLKEEARIKAEQLKKRSELNTNKILPPKSNVNDSKVTKLKNKARVLPTSILTQGKSTLKSNRKELDRLLLGR